MNSLHPQQREAFEWLMDFIKSKHTVATLSGSAGTGKTYLIKYIVERLKIPFCITAPTHKALRVLEESVNRKGRTFHSLHGLRPNVDLATFDLNNVSFDPNGEPYAQYYKLILCDECSQIGETLNNLNIKRALQYGYKIIYIGDSAQLPPVSKGDYESESPTFKVAHRFNLTQIVRQEEGNPLLEPFHLLRDDITHKTATFRKHIFYNRDTIVDGMGYKIYNTREYTDILKEVYCSEDFRRNPNLSRNIAYTNDTVTHWNKIIRNMMYPDSKSILERGDLLMAYNTIVDDFNEPLFVNSETYQVENIRDYVNDYDIKVFAVNLVNKDTSLPTTTLQIVDHTDKSFLRYYTILSQLHSHARGSNPTTKRLAWKKFFDFKNEMLTMIPFKLPAKNNYQHIKKDFDYGYSITAHKSQGSTFNMATVDLQDMIFFKDVATGNLKKYYNIDLVNKLIYVAMTRVEKKVHIHL